MSHPDFDFMKAGLHNKVWGSHLIDSTVTYCLPHWKYSHMPLCYFLYNMISTYS